MSSSLTLNCLLWGEYSWNISTITIESTRSVADLKEAIRSKRPNTLRDIDDVDISIYNGIEDAVLRICQATRLSGKQELSELFPTALDDENLHIVTKVPLDVSILPVNLICIVKGKILDPNQIFQVTIDRRRTVFELEEVIKKAALDSRDHVLTGSLKIWSVSIPVDDSFGERIEELCSHQQVLPEIGPLSVYFPIEPKSEHLHVIVEAPEATVDNSPPKNQPSLGLDEKRKQYSEVNGPLSPSVGAVPNVYRQRQEQDDEKVLSARPRHVLSFIPLQLLHPVFGQFADDCQTYPVTSFDNARVLKLADAMSHLFEDRRAEDIRAEFNDFAGFGMSGYRIDRDGNISAGGFRCAIMEFKDEVGYEGAEPYLQAGLRYFEATRDFAHQRPDSTFPCFLVLVFGPLLYIAGAVWTERPAMQVLSAALPFHFHPTDVQMQTNIARHLGALKKGIRSLGTYYRDLRGRPLEVPSQCFPYPVEFTDRSDGGRRGFKYTGQVSETLLLFSAITADSKQEIMVKFVQTYSEEAHLFCAERDYAPALFGFERLPGGWFMVVMESLQGRYVNLSQCDYVTRNLCNAIEEKLVEFHQAGFVHGDFRDVNIMVLQPIKVSFMFIDFDWAGKIGEARYPPNVSRTEIWRPRGATDGELIQAEDDIEMLQHMIGNWFAT